MMHSDAAFNAKYQQETEALLRLEALDTSTVGSSALKRISTLHKLSREGVTAVLRKAERFPARQQEITQLLEEFLRYGAKAVLSTGAQRGGDFLNNQLRGQWAERVVLSMNVECLQFLPFGPSGAAMPGEEDHREVVMTFKEIHLLEGKRPDLLAFHATTWQAMTLNDRDSTADWPKRRLNPKDEASVRRAVCGIEVKNSTWHYEKRRGAGGGPLSITVKAEEVSEIAAWCSRYSLPVIFIQVLFDELYCMSFSRMRDAIARGFLYRQGDYMLDEQTGEKNYHRFLLQDFRHRCGCVAFPDESTAEIRLLEDGNVVPFINFQPALAAEVVSEVVRNEIDYS